MRRRNSFLRFDELRRCPIREVAIVTVVFNTPRAPVEVITVNGSRELTGKHLNGVDHCEVKLEKKIQIDDGSKDEDASSDVVGTNRR